MPRFELERWAIAQCRVQALLVVDGFDEGTDAALGLPVIAVEPAVDLLGLERLHEALGLGVVIDPMGAVDSDRLSGRVRLLTHPLWRRPCML